MPSERDLAASLEIKQREVQLLREQLARQSLEAGRLTSSLTGNASTCQACDTRFANVRSLVQSLRSVARVVLKLHGSPSQTAVPDSLRVVAQSAEACTAADPRFEQLSTYIKQGLFNLLDRNGDGHLSPEEFETLRDS